MTRADSLEEIIQAWQLRKRQPELIDVPTELNELYRGLELVLRELNEIDGRSRTLDRDG